MTDSKEKTTAAEWKEKKTKLKAMYLFLDDADLNYEAGKMDLMMNNLQIKLGKTRDQLAQIIAAL